MNDKNLRAEELANKLFNKMITPEEEQELHSWYNEHLDDQVEIPHGFVSSEEEHRVRILEAINVIIGKRRVVRLWPRVAVAVAAITLGVWLYYTTSNSSLSFRVSRNLYANDIAPGKHAATLTLANGKVIALSDAKSGVVIGDALKYSDGSDVRYSPGSRSSGSLKGSQSSAGPVGARSLTPAELQGTDGKAQILTANTAKGQTYQFTLPDGTKVWLNAASSLRFPNRFVEGKRYVQLRGEAYFEVAKDRAHPFIVTSSRQRIEVLGTHFNVSVYPDEETATTTLMEGSITIDNKLLKPNQEAVSMHWGGLVISNVDSSDAMAWKDGKFRFNDTDLEVVLRQLGRWYDVDIKYIGEIPDRKFTGGIDRDINASEALDILKYLKVNFKIEGKTIIVSK
jgi:transmembrane sensor